MLRLIGGYSRREVSSGAKQIAEKVALQSEEQPQRLKPIDFVALTARLEAATFQNKIKTGVFQQTVKPAFLLASSGTAVTRTLPKTFMGRCGAPEFLAIRPVPV